MYHKRLLSIVKRVLSGLLVLSGFLVLFLGRAGVAVSSDIYNFDPSDEGISVLLYHRIGEEQKHPSTSVSIEQFRSHLDYLQANNYEVVPLDVALMQYQKGKKRVAITFDDGFLSIKKHALKELEARSMPFTVFLNSTSHKQAGGDFMTWDIIKTMLAGGMASIGSHGTHQDSMLDMSEDKIRDSIAKDIVMLQEKTGVTPNLFSYPYGEVKELTPDTIASLGIVAAFGQHSGVVAAVEDPYFLPRFSMNFLYGSIDRLKTILQSSPLPAHMVFPATRIVDNANKGIVLAVGMEIGNLQCFGNGEKLNIEYSQDKQHILIKLVDKVVTHRRYRINCTMPHEQKKGHYRWKGLVLFGK